MIDYRNELNPAQLEAATALEGPVLVVAGAGSGKTRTIVYRLVRLVESGVPASGILLLTFTRKAAGEMLERARRLLGDRGMPGLAEGAGNAGLSAVQGGTFHSWAYSVLRLFQPEGYGKNLSVMDNHDMLEALRHCRDEKGIGKGDRSFPKGQAVLGFISKSRNKETALEEVLRKDAGHLLPHADSLAELAESYALYKKTKNLLDYDDLLFALETVLRENPEALAYCRRRHQYIMVDEYQDTNPVQARLAALTAGLSPEWLAGGCKGEPIFEGGKPGNILAVGDDAQSIYAFRGADVRNILRFPDLFPGTRIVRLEENYRSTQPVLDLANEVLKGATEGYAKHLYTRRAGGEKPNVVRPLSDRSQAAIAAARLTELMREYSPSDIAVLFRSGFHSYSLELELNKLGIRFRKYGGIRYTEAAHIKDVMCYVRLVLNPADFTAFARMAELCKGVGPKTCLKLYGLLLSGDTAGLAKAAGKYPDFEEDLRRVDAWRGLSLSPVRLLSEVLEHYRPRLEAAYPEDYPRRMQGLEQLLQIAQPYKELDLFVADLSLDDPLREEEGRESLTLSTIHSAKGLEWPAVMLLDLVEERFPSKHSLARQEDFEEERRLMYVACTRAGQYLDLFVPASIYDRGSGGSIPAVPSPFVRELPPSLYVELQESYTGGLREKRYGEAPSRRAQTPASFSGREGSGLLGSPIPRPLLSDRSDFGGCDAEDDVPALGQGKGPAGGGACGFCRHRIFGRGKIVQHLPPDKYRVNFPGLGLKVIMAAYLTLEE